MFAPVIMLRDRAGTAAVEFAMVLPIAVSMFLGSFEISNLLLCHMKLVAAAQTAADLMAQQKTVCAANVTDYGTAAGLVMEPLSPGNLSVAFSSVIYAPNTNAASTDWHQEVNGAASNAPTAPNAAANANLGSNGSSSTIVATANYAYTSPLSYVLKKNYTFTETAFAQPRLVPNIPKPTC
jgi:Flp pilus assembly protein TadG